MTGRLAGSEPERLETTLLSRKNGIALLLGIALGIFLVMLRIQIRHPLLLTQPVSYHDFADQRAWLGIPNFLNVVSNLPFAIIGMWGMTLVAGSNSRRVFINALERWPYFGIFFGLFLTAFGSAWYHLAPGNSTLVWDRLPMTIMFGSFVAAVIAERIDVGAGVALLLFLVAFSVGSVLQWHHSEVIGHSDLRWYAAVQVYSVLVLLIAPILPERYTRNWDFLIVFAWYALAKIFEIFDRLIYSVGHIVSGHTLKHLAAAGAGYWILRMLRLRAPLTQNSSAINTPALSSYSSK